MAKRILYLGLDPTHYYSSEEVTHWPIIQIVPRPLTDRAVHQALMQFESYSHLVVTSKSTVAILQDYLPRLGIDLQTWKSKATLAVGKVTAQHLQACGITPLRVAQEETAEGIVQELQHLPLENAHIFWPHSSQARPVIKNFLEAQLLLHTTCILYDPMPHLPVPLPLLENFDEIVFTSPSTVDAFLKIFGHFPTHTRLIPIGPVTARYLNLSRYSNGLTSR